MKGTNANTVADAVRNLPGVSLSRHNRNEEMVNLRGFHSRQLAIYVDGVPLYVPYDGYVDLGRFTTFDLAEINVAKAGASLLCGPNALGGAVNPVTRKPRKSFEADVRLGFANASERKADFILEVIRAAGNTNWAPLIWRPTAFSCPKASRIAKSSLLIPPTRVRMQKSVQTSACPSSWG